MSLFANMVAAVLISASGDATVSTPRPALENSVDVSNERLREISTIAESQTVINGVDFDVNRTWRYSDYA